MFNFLKYQPALKKSQERMIRFDFSNRALSFPVGEFHNCEIVHPAYEGNRIEFVYLFIPKNDENWYMAFKPIMSSKRKTVTIVYEFGGDYDCELATMALMYLLKTKLAKSHPPLFKIPEYDEILTRFENPSLHEVNNQEWEAWKRL